MLSRPQRRASGAVLSGLLLFQALFMAVGACAQTHGDGHASGQGGTPGHHGVHGVAEGAGLQDTSAEGPQNAAGGHVHPGAGEGGAADCCARHHPVDPAGPTAPALVDGAMDAGAAPYGPAGCAALAGCGVPALSVEGRDRLRVASLGEWAAVPSVPTAPRIVDLSIVTPPPKIL